LLFKELVSSPKALFEVFMKNFFRFLIVALLLSVGAKAQQTWFTQALYKTELGRIEARTTTSGIVFSFEKNYPPPSLPYRYLSSTPKDGLLPFQVRSNLPGLWSLTLEIPDLRDGTGRLLVPAKQIMVRVNNGPWLRGNNAPQIIYTQNGATRDWSDLRLEFAIELIGGEVAGTYAVQTYFGAVVQP
jgi:hypothetical protein